MNGGKAALPPSRPRAVRAAVQSTGPENGDYAAFARRVVKAFAKRVGEGDVEALPDLLDLEQLLERETAAAVAGLRAAPHFYSNRQIADRLGVSREAVRQRWPQPAELPGREPGGQPVDRR